MRANLTEAGIFRETKNFLRKRKRFLTDYGREWYSDISYSPLADVYYFKAPSGRRFVICAMDVVESGDRRRFKRLLRRGEIGRMQ